MGRGLALTVDACIAGLVVTASLAMLAQQETSTPELEKLEKQLVFQQAQDATEACLAKNDLSEQCFSFLSKVNGKLDYCLAFTGESCRDSDMRITRANFTLFVYEKN